MDRVFQVFISSTFADLAGERRLVSNTLAKAGYVAAGMELFPATDQDQLAYIKRIIDRSDYYVVIVAGRYGSTSDDGVSYTEKEFEYAVSKGIPVLAFLHANPGSIPANKVEAAPDIVEKLEAFRARLKTGRVIEFWNDGNDLCTKVAIAVFNAANLTPGVGWVRGNNAIDPVLLQDMERLRKENDELRIKLKDSLDANIVHFDPILIGPDAELELSIECKKGQTESHVAVAATFGKLFIWNYNALLAGPAELIMRRTIGNSFVENGLITRERLVVYRCSHTDLVIIRNQFEALGLIRPENRPGPSGKDHVVWVLTEKGRRYYASHKALRVDQVQRQAHA